MPSIPDTDISTAEVTINATLAAAGSNVVPIANVFHYTRDSTVPVLSKTSLATKFIADIVDLMVLGQSSRYVVQNVSIRWVDDALDAPLEVADASAGAIGTDSLPADSAVFMLLKTSLRGRRYMGRKFFAGIPEAHTTGDVLNVTGLPFWEDVRDQLMLPSTDAEGNVWRLQVLSRMPPSQLTANPTTVVRTEVTTVKLNSRITDLDRRKAGSVYV